MGDSLHELARLLRAAAATCIEQIDLEAWPQAKESARECLSLGSKVHARLVVMQELAADARWMAAVDRAIPKPAAQIDGQLTIADAVKAAQNAAKAAPNKRQPRKKG